MAAMLLYALVGFASPESMAAIGPAFLVALVAYALTVFIIFGAARLAYQGFMVLLAMGTALSLAISAMVTGLTSLYQVVAAWGILSAGGTAFGYLLQRQSPFGRAYFVGLALVTGFALVYWVPSISELMANTEEGVAVFMEEVEAQVSAMGYDAQEGQLIREELKRVLHLVVRMLPSAILLGIMAQYSLGCLLFMRWRHRIARQSPSPPFRTWQMPFAFTPVLMLAILVRLLGGEDLRVLADNGLAVLSVFYCVTGLSVAEFYFTKMKASAWLRVAFYVLLFLTQLIGFLITAVVGFIDSFADWRKVRSQNIVC